jgi:uncharacterized Zn finger protein (UPF0148 family)
MMETEWIPTKMVLGGWVTHGFMCKECGEFFQSRTVYCPECGKKAKNGISKKAAKKRKEKNNG